MKTTLARRRKKLGLSQAQLAALVQKRAGKAFSQQAYSKLEKNPDAESRFFHYIMEIFENLEGGGEKPAQVKEAAAIYEALSPAGRRAALTNLKALLDLERESGEARAGTSRELPG